MRRLNKSLLVLSSIVAAFASCSKEKEAIQNEVLPTPKDGGFTMTVNAGNPETKTVISESGTGYAILWKANDQLGVFEVANGEVQDKAESAPLTGDPTANATFSIDLPTPAPTKPYKYAFVYPSDALGVTEINSNNAYTISLKQNQTFSAASFDESADILVSELIKAPETRPSSVDAAFARIGATARMVIKCPITTETIKSITFSTTEGNISGYYTFDPATGVVSSEIVEGQKSVVLTPVSSTEFTGNVVVWFRLAAITLKNNFTVTVTTNAKVYTKVVDLATAKRELEFADSKLTKFNVSMTAKDATFEFSKMGYSNEDAIGEKSSNGITLYTNKGTNANNAPTYYTNGTAGRFYGGNTFKLSTATGYSIVGVTLIFGSSDGSNAISADSGLYNAGSWEGAASSVEFTIGGTTGNRRIVKISVSYLECIVSELPDERQSSSIVANDIEMFVGQTKSVAYEIVPDGGEVKLDLGEGAEGKVSIDNDKCEVTADAETEGVPIELSFNGNDDYKPTEKEITVVVFAVPAISSFEQTKNGFTATVEEMIEGFTYSWVLYKGSISNENIVSNDNRTFTTTTIAGSNADDLFENITPGNKYLLVITASKASSEASANSESASFDAIDLDNIADGDTWTYEFSEKQWGSAGDKLLGDKTWNMSGTGNNGFFGYDGTKGQQFGSGSSPFSALTLKSNFGNTYGVRRVSVWTSGAANINASMSIEVGGVSFKVGNETSISLTDSNTEYTFITPDGNVKTGDIKISYSNSSNKAIYVKKIVVNDVPVTLSSISVSGQKTEFSLNDEFSFGGTVTATYNNNTNAEVTESESLTFTGYDMSTVGNQTVTVSYTEDSITKTTTYNITVTEWDLESISVTTPPDIVIYTVGQTFNPTGMVVTAHYVDHNDSNNENDVVIDNDDLFFSPGTDIALTTDISTISITYQGKETSQAITVNSATNKTNQMLFHETFGNNDGSARAWSDDYSVKSGIGDVYSGITSYTVSNVKQGKNTTGSTESGLNQSSQGTDAYIIIGPLNVADAEKMVLTYQWKAGSIGANYFTKLYYATSSTGIYTEVTGTGNGATTFVERSYNLPEAAQVNTLYLKIVWNTSNTQGIIDEVNLQGDYPTQTPSSIAPMNVNSWGTLQ